MIILLLAVFGFIFGSFVNALVWRLHEHEELRDRLQAVKDEPVEQGAAAARRQRLKVEKLEHELRDKSMLHGRSMCSNCQHPLATRDLIPFFSWLWLRGRCRYCRQPIQDSGLVDLAVPLLFVGSYVFWPQPLQGYGLLALGFWLVFLVGFVALAIYDSRWFLLPDRIVWPLVALAVLQVVLHATVFGGGREVWLDAGWGVVIGSGVFMAIYTLAERLGKEWIGFGDVKLGLALGLLVGGPLEAIIMLYIASLAGLIVIVPLLLRRRMTKASLIPYGPFLIFACIVVVVFQPSLVGWLKQFLLLS